MNTWIAHTVRNSYRMFRPIGFEVKLNTTRWWLANQQNWTITKINMESVLTGKWAENDINKENFEGQIETKMDSKWNKLWTNNFEYKNSNQNAQKMKIKMKMKLSHKIWHIEKNLPTNEVKSVQSAFWLLRNRIVSGHIHEK